MNSYLALLRGVNVGGKGLLSMSELKNTLTTDGLSEVRTYINSGNIIFSSAVTDTDKLAALIRSSIEREHKLTVDVAVFSKSDWEQIIAAAPAWWGKDNTWKHNLLVMIRPHEPQDVITAIGQLKPEIEAIKVGDGVLYQSLSLASFGRTTVHKLVSSPVYKQMTIRNYNTATKLVGLLGATSREV